MNRACLLSRRSAHKLSCLALLGAVAAALPLLPATIAIAAPATVQLAQLSTRPTLRLGSTGNAVSEIQAMLILLGYLSEPVDGRYQAPTEAAVKEFQADVGLSSDGIVGPATWEKLLPSPSTELTPPKVPDTPTAEAPDRDETEADTPIALPTLRQGITGPAVMRVQETLRARGFYNGAIDGIFGPGTEEAVMEFQRSVQLAADGVVGPATWQALLQ
ncbi:MAG: peptidoglycan-binding protein [Leptolyngbyaceae cyanobacterium]